MAFSLVNQLFWGSTIYGNPHVIIGILNILNGFDEFIVILDGLVGESHLPPAIWLATGVTYRSL